MMYEVRLLPGAESILDAVAFGRWASPELYRLRLQAEHARLVAGFDELISLETLNFAPFEYQVKAAQVVLRRFRGRGLLCDEVGLGKTIEAGLVLKEYLMRQMVNRVPEGRGLRNLRFLMTGVDVAWRTLMLERVEEPCIASAWVMKREFYRALRSRGGRHRSCPFGAPQRDGRVEVVWEIAGRGKVG